MRVEAEKGAKLAPQHGNHKPEEASYGATAPTATPAKWTKKFPETTDIIELEIDKNYHVAVNLHSKFNIFPMLLRKTLQAGYSSTIRSQMDALTNKTAVKDEHTFSVVQNMCARQSLPDTGARRKYFKTQFPSLSLANTALLELFSKDQKQYLEKPVFVQLRTEAGATNEDFIYLHAVHVNEIGRGFDCNGLFITGSCIQGERQVEGLCHVRAEV